MNKFRIYQRAQYWGGQRFSGGAIYMGAIMFALFLLGLIFVKDTLKWPFLALGFVILFLVGKENFINDLFLNHFPMYNKFRDSKMILVILQVIVPAMALIFVDKLTKKEALLGSQKSWLIGSGAMLGLLALLYISPSISGSFLKSEEIKQFSDAAGSVKEADKIEMINGIKSTLIDARKEIFRADIGR